MSEKIHSTKNTGICPTRLKTVFYESETGLGSFRWKLYIAGRGIIKLTHPILFGRASTTRQVYRFTLSVLKQRMRETLYLLRVCEFPRLVTSRPIYRERTKLPTEITLSNSFRSYLCYVNAGILPNER